MPAIYTSTNAASARSTTSVRSSSSLLSLSLPTSSFLTSSPRRRVSTSKASTTSAAIWVPLRDHHSSSTHRTDNHDEDDRKTAVPIIPVWPIVPNVPDPDIPNPPKPDPHTPDRQAQIPTPTRPAGHSRPLPVGPTPAPLHPPPPAPPTPPQPLPTDLPPLGPPHPQPDPAKPPPPGPPKPPPPPPSPPPTNSNPPPPTVPSPIPTPSPSQCEGTSDWQTQIENDRPLTDRLRKVAKKVRKPLDWFTRLVRKLKNQLKKWWRNPTKHDLSSDQSVLPPSSVVLNAREKLLDAFVKGMDTLLLNEQQCLEAAQLIGGEYFVAWHEHLRSIHRAQGPNAKPRFSTPALTYLLDQVAWDKAFWALTHVEDVLKAACEKGNGQGGRGNTVIQRKVINQVGVAFTEIDNMNNLAEIARNAHDGTGFNDQEQVNKALSDLKERAEFLVRVFPVDTNVIIKRAELEGATRELLKLRNKWVRIRDGVWAMSRPHDGFRSDMHWIVDFQIRSITQSVHSVWRTINGGFTNWKLCNPTEFALRSSVRALMDGAPGVSELETFVDLYKVDGYIGKADQRRFEQLMVEFKQQPQDGVSESSDMDMSDIAIPNAEPPTAPHDNPTIERAKTQRALRLELLNKLKTQGAIINPEGTVAGRGTWSWLQEGVDDVVAHELGFNTPEEVSDARRQSNMRVSRSSNIEARPVVAFKPDHSYVNPVRPMGTGQWKFYKEDGSHWHYESNHGRLEFLTHGDRVKAMNYWRAESADDILRLRMDEAQGREWTDDINIVWIPAR